MWRSPKSPTFHSWESMIARCTRPRHVAFRHYGGRGISVCERWMRFTGFLDDMGERPEGTSLDRIDNSRGYEPGNCRWATARTQRRNSRQNRYLSAFGATATLVEWSELSGIGFSTIRERLRHGWEPEDAVSEPVYATVKRGACSPTAKLTADDVRDVRRRSAAGERRSDIARRFGVSRRAVQFIVERRNWAHVSDAEELR